MEFCLIYTMAQGQGKEYFNNEKIAQRKALELKKKGYNPILLKPSKKQAYEVKHFALSD